MTDLTRAEMTDWLAALCFQQEHRDGRIPHDDLLRCWDAYLDAVLEHREVPDA